MSTTPKPDRGHHPNSAQTRFTGKGLGTKNKLSPISVRFSADAHAVLIGMEDRQDYIRAAVLAKLEADGLLERSDRFAEQKPDIRQEYYDDFIQRRQARQSTDL